MSFKPVFSCFFTVKMKFHVFADAPCTYIQVYEASKT